MTKRDGIQMISELEAAEKLLARGYTKAECETCKGTGHFQVGEIDRMCHTCEGTGWVWGYPPPSK